MKPITRLEHFLAKIAGDKDAKNLKPITRKEYYLNEIAEGGGGSGGGTVFVDCTSDGSELTAEKTAGEIFEAVESGLIVIFKFTSGPMSIYMYCFFANNMDGYNFAVAVQSGSNFVVNKFTAGDSSDNPVLIIK